MSEFIKQYGSIVVYSIVGMLLIGILYGAFPFNWARYGLTVDSEKTDFPLTMRKGKPLIKVEDIKIQCGTKIDDVRKLVEAREYDGEEIQISEVFVKAFEGDEFLDGFNLKTDKPAKIKLLYSVLGKNGEIAEKQQIILIDEGGKGIEISH